MKTATPGKFDVFQWKIFPVIATLTAKPEHSNHPFTEKWVTLRRHPSMPMTAKTSWRNVKILLGITSMHDYRDFLVKCPDIDNAVKFRNSTFTRSGFDYGILPTFRVSPKSRGSFDG